MENTIKNTQNNEEQAESEIIQSVRNKFMKFTKKRIIIIALIAVIGGLIGGFSIYKATRPVVYKTTTAQKGIVMEEVSVTGRVKPAESVDLAFETGGKISGVYVKIGQRVSKDRMLVSLSSGELSAQLLQAKADLKAQEAKLDELKRGTRTEEIQIAETNLENTKSKAEADLKNDYDAALTSIQDGVVKGKNAVLTLSDLQFKYYTGSEQEDLIIADAKKAAVKELLGTDNAGRLATEYISKLTGGAFGLVEGAIADPTNENIDLALSKTLSALQKVKTMLDVVPIKTEYTTTEKSDLSSEKTTINSSITTISSKEQEVQVQKVTKENNIKTAEDNLALKLAGATGEEIKAQEARVESATASVQNIQAKINKTVILSPINGIVSKQDAKMGEIVSANTTLVSLVSAVKFEVETFVPEVDVAKVSIGDTVRITLDAYGNNIQFPASVVSVEPAETMIEGVATYKTVLQFNEDDERIKSGMTANIDIMTDRRENVIFVPARVVSTKNGSRYVEILEGEKVKKVEVEVGIRGSDGNIEIISGIEEGEEVIL